MVPKPARRPHSRLWPGRWPVRWRLAAVTSILTFLILLLFAVVIGRFMESRLTNDFRDEINDTADQLALNIVVNPAAGQFADNDALRQIAQATDGIVAIVDTTGGPPLQLTGDPVDLPAADPAGLATRGSFEVATRQLISTYLGLPIYIQYGRDRSELDRTLGRMWLFLMGGILGGTLLAGLAGIVIAGRAMRPVSSLTAAAREIATTRDPSLRIPEPSSEDEISELARTLDEMLGELDAARGETQQMVQAQREFVADASHELRTPLTSILANLELLQERFETPGHTDEAEMVGSALRSSRRMRRLVADLLVLAKADAGRHGERRPCDLADIALAAADEVRAIAGDHSIVLGEIDDAVVEGDSDELHRIVVNLLENGVSHTPAGTSVRLTVAIVAGRARVEIADDGPGIPPGFGDQIFARFVRVDGPADLSRSNGTGLGLAIVKAIAVAHGGSVSAGRSEDLGGAAFVVDLPLSGGSDGRSGVDSDPRKVSANV